jgi:hypothetical protein
VGRISAQLTVLAMMLHVVCSSLEEQISATKREFLLLVGNEVAKTHETQLIFMDLCMMGSSLMSNGEKVSSLFVRVEGTWLICQLEKVKTLTVFCSLCSDIA